MYQDTHNIYCEACGYDLRDQRSGDCPECGEHFDRRQGCGYLDTQISAFERHVRKFYSPLGGVFYLITGLVVFGLYVLPPRDRFHLFIAIGMWVIGFASLIRRIFWPPSTKGLA